MPTLSLRARGLSHLVVYLKLFEKLYAPLINRILKPFKDDVCLQKSQTSLLDRPYRTVPAPWIFLSMLLDSESPDFIRINTAILNPANSLAQSTPIEWEKLALLAHGSTQYASRATTTVPISSKNHRKLCVRLDYSELETRNSLQKLPPDTTRTKLSFRRP